MQAEASYNVVYMYIFENVPLSTLSTMRLGGMARFMCNIENRNELIEAHNWAKEKNVPLKLIGGGSNIIWKDEGFSGLVAVNKIKGYEFFEVDDENVYVTVGSGEDWDEVVEKCINQGYSGIESLSLIPGTAGSTPIQNVGAYGSEIKDVLTTIEAFDREKDEFVIIKGGDCGFSYRSSRFKKEDKDRFLISSITMSLSKQSPEPPFYGAVEKYLTDNGITKASAKDIRKAVIEIRTEKLPNPKQVANCGSFFHNPIVSSDKAMEIIKKHPDIPHWPLDNNEVKLSAAWLIENSGFQRGYQDKDTGMSLWKNQALVVVNDSATKTAELQIFTKKLTSQVFNKFNITLSQEPEIA